MPIKRRQVPKKNAPPHQSTPRILSADEKRQLILAHAATRHPHDPIQRASMWAGVFISVAFLIGLWTYTVGSGIKQTLATPTDDGLIDAFETAKEKTDSQVIGDLSNRLLQIGDAEVAPSAKPSAIVNGIISNLTASSTDKTVNAREDLFKAKIDPVTSTTSESYE